MKKALSTVTLAFCFACLFAGKGLVVTQKYNGPDANGGDVTVTWYVTDAQCKMKMDFKDNKVSSVNWFIPDAAQSQLLIYTEGPVPAGAEKTYYSIPVNQIKTTSNADASGLKVVRTGETKTLSGMVCEKITITGNQSVTEMWVTRDFVANAYKYTSFFRTITELQGLNQEKIAGFPMASVTKDNSGKVISSFELVSASTSELSDSDFKVPAEYKAAPAR